MTLGLDYAGMKTGYGKVVNGYMYGLEHWDKYSDGDTVVECEKDDPQAMRVQDAYEALRDEWAAEKAYYDQLLGEWQEDHRKAQEDPADAYEQLLYDIQDRLEYA
jgi:hypothetical protein